jgi:hypothetical protein
MTPEQAGVAVAAKAYSKRGLQYHNRYSYFGQWFHPNYAYALWCAMFASWATAEALGRDMCIKLIGQQYSWSTGHAWTVSLMNDIKRLGGTKQSFDSARAGDFVFWNFPGNSRSTNPTNHVDIVYTGNTGNLLPCVGGNTPPPGSYTDPSEGRGVYLHNRSRSYYNSYGVTILRPNYAKYYKSAPSTPYKTRAVPLGMGLGKKSELSKIIQDILNRPITGTLNSGDIAEVKKLQKSLKVEADGFFGPGTSRAYVKSKSNSKLNYTLREGARGDVVKLIQYCVGIPLKDIDGVWGQQTTTYVKKAQSYHKLAVDGIFGEQSRKKIIHS